MSFGVRGLDFTDGSTGIDLGGAQRGVAEQPLNISEIGAAGHEMSGTGVPQRLLILLISSRWRKFITAITRFTGLKSQ
jgi:hypothetical protein